MTHETQVTPERMTPLEFLEEVYTCNDLPLPTRMKAATAAAPYVHPKLQATAILTAGDMGDRLDHANKRVAGLKAARANGVLVERNGQRMLLQGVLALTAYTRGEVEIEGTVAKVIEGEVIEKGPAEASPSLVPMRRL